MTDNIPYIDKDGEVRELDDAFFAKAKAGHPPMFSSRRVPEIIDNNPAKNLEIQIQIENEPDTWEPLEEGIPRRR